MLDTVRNAFRIPDLRRRILFTLGMFIVFRVGVFVPVPGMDHAYIDRLIQEGTIFGLVDLFSGGALKNFSVFAMSVTPYINASIIMQLLTIVLPSLEQLAKEGDEGRKKLTQYTRYGTVVLALIQGVGTAVGLRQAIINYQLHPFLYIFVVAVTLTAGTSFLMWLGEQITERGIGNGISLIIFAGIVARLPSGLGVIWEYLRAGSINILNVALLVVIALGVILAVVWMQEGERKIPVQYAKRVVGRRVYGGQSTHLPMRVNSAGVIPVIFAASVLTMPVTIANFFPSTTGWVAWIQRNFSFGSALYTAVYALMIIFFTYFYSAITFNPIEISDNIKKYGGFVPGFRPGKPTADYLMRVSTRLTLPGSMFLALIAILPIFVTWATGIRGLYFGGTALLIVVGVALETMKQIEAHLMMRHYQGFIR